MAFERRRMFGSGSRSDSAILASLLIVGAQAVAQQVPPNLTKEDLARNNKLFIELASKVLKWDVPTDPVKVVGPLYFVGTAGLSS